MKEYHGFYKKALGFMLLSPLATVAIAEQGVYVAPTIGYYVFDEDNDNNADDAFMYGLGLGYQVNNYFAVEANFFGLEPEVEQSGFDVDGTEDIDTQYYRLGANFSLDLSVPWSPYLSVGYGKLEVDPQFSDDDDWMMDVGVGIKQTINPALAVRSDVRALHSWDNEDTDYSVNLGLVYLFGAKLAAPPQVADASPVIEQPTTDECADDTDGDGVPDCRDRCPGSDARAAINAEGCYIKDQVIDSIELKVLFDYDKAMVKPVYYPEIERVAKFMQQHPDTKADIEGHTDSAGSDVYNQKLSQRRAEAVRTVLMNQFNIAPHRLQAIGYGETRPIASNTTSAGRQANRRVVAVLQTVVEEVKMK